MKERKRQRMGIVEEKRCWDAILIDSSNRQYAD